MSTYEDASIIIPESAGYKASKIYGLEPISGDADLAFSRNTACDEINSLGVSTQVAANVPRYDYKADYVVPVDNSYYSSDGTSSIARANIVQNTFPFTVTGTFKQSSVSGFQFVFGNNKAVASDTYFSMYFNEGAAFINRRNTSAINTSLGFTSVVDTEYHYRVEFTDDTTVKLWIDDVSVFSNTGLTSVLLTGVDNFLVGDYRFSGGGSPLIGSVKNFRVWNKVLTAQEGTDIYNGVSMPEKYKGANNVDFTAGAFTVGKQYRIATAGTTDFTLIGATNSSVGTEFTATGIGTGTGTATSIGNTLNLSTGKTSAIWYDLDHDIQATITGATLTDSNGFGTNVHSLETCPSLLLEPSFTTYFKTSRVPITQTVVGLSIGTVYTINCKGTGIITIDEVGGVGRGGTATEVNSFTYTATQTSVVITLVAGESFDWVQMTNTAYPMNHVETLTTTVTKALDTANKGSLSALINSESLIFNVSVKALFNDSIDRSISLSDGTSNNRISIEHKDSGVIKVFVIVGGVTVYNYSTSLYTVTDMQDIKLKVKAGDFGVKINDIEIDSQDSGVSFSAVVLNRFGFDGGSGANYSESRFKKLEIYNGILNY